MTQRILIVDDSLTVRMDLAEAFVQAKLAAHAAASVTEARALLGAEQFDLVVLDVILPDGDGVSLLAEIKTARADLPVILLSTEAEVADRIRGLKTGADDYIAKPYDAHHIVARARTLLGRTDTAHGDAVLVIDDSPTFRMRLREALETEFYAVLEANSGEEGLRIAANAHPAAILVDGMLPGIDGVTVIRRIRMDAGLRHTPCILLTAANEQAAEIVALDAGADAFVRKDEEVGVILARLAAVLRSLDGPRATLDGRHAREKTGLLDFKKMLVVDDSETFLRVLADRLHAEGYEVLLARTGEEALSLLCVQKVDCILLDLMMPGIGGEETCRRIKQAPAMRAMPVILLTGQEDREAMICGLGAGADDYVTKASDFEVLRARILAQLRRKQFEDENRSIRERLAQQEMEAVAAKAARELGELQAVLAERQRAQEQMTALQSELAHVSRWNAMGMMAASLAHELNQPLTAVKNYVTAARRQLGTESTRAGELMDKAAEQAMQAGAIIKNLREFIEKRETGRTFEDVNAVVEEAIGLGLVDGNHEGLELKVELAPGLPRALINKIQIQQVLVNLFRNGVEAMAKAAQHRLTVATGLDEGGFVGVTVADTGPGVTPDKLEKLFQPFSATDGARGGSSKEGGMGIGLKICQSIIESHGGRIWLTANSGPGVTFHFLLPAPAESVHAG